MPIRSAAKSQPKAAAHGAERHVLEHITLTGSARAARLGDALAESREAVLVDRFTEDRDASGNLFVQPSANRELGAAACLRPGGARGPVGCRVRDLPRVEAQKAEPEPDAWHDVAHGDTPAHARFDLKEGCILAAGRRDGAGRWNE